MNIKRVEVEFRAGQNIEKSVEQLKEAANEYGVQAYGIFNTYELTSDMSVDDAHLLIIGMTKEEREKVHQEWLNNAKREEEECKKNLPNLEKLWIEKAKGIVREEKIDMWNTVVPIRLSDIYKGSELGWVLKLIEMLDINNCTLEEAKEEFDNQGHSGMSAGLTLNMIREFCIRGEEFTTYIDKKGYN